MDIITRAFSKCSCDGKGGNISFPQRFSVSCVNVTNDPADTTVTAYSGTGTTWGNYTTEETATLVFTAAGASSYPALYKFDGGGMLAAADTASLFAALNAGAKWSICLPASTSADDVQVVDCDVFFDASALTMTLTFPVPEVLRGTVIASAAGYGLFVMYPNFETPFALSVISSQTLVNTGAGSAAYTTYSRNYTPRAGTTKAYPRLLAPLPDLYPDPSGTIPASVSGHYQTSRAYLYNNASGMVAGAGSVAVQLYVNVTD
jgi:hypothetical protein